MDENIELLQKLKIKILYESEIIYLGIYSRKLKPVLKFLYTQVVIAIQFLRTSIWNLPKWQPVNEWTQKIGIYENTITFDH